MDLEKELQREFDKLSINVEKILNPPKDKPKTRLYYIMVNKAPEVIKRLYFKFKGYQK